MSNRRYFKDVSNARKNGNVVHTDDAGVADWFAKQARWKEVEAPAGGKSATPTKSEPKSEPKAAPKAESKTATKAAPKANDE